MTNVNTTQKERSVFFFQKNGSCVQTNCNGVFVDNKCNGSEKNGCCCPESYEASRMASVRAHVKERACELSFGKGLLACGSLGVLLELERGGRFVLVCQLFWFVLVCFGLQQPGSRFRCPEFRSDPPTSDPKPGMIPRPCSASPASGCSKLGRRAYQKRQKKQRRKWGKGRLMRSR